MRWLVALCFVTACGRTEPIEPRPAALAPRVGADGGVFCRYGCPGEPPGVVTPLATRNGQLLHWPSCEGCLRVTTPSATSPSNGPSFRSVLNIWDIALGGGLCLDQEVRVAEAVPPGARQLIHVRSGNDAVRFVADEESGALQYVEIETSSLSSDAFMFLIGRALGLEASSETRLSLMSFPNSLRSDPGPDDLASLRALYGPPQPWCR